MTDARAIREVLARVRGRWQALVLLRVVGRTLGSWALVGALGVAAHHVVASGDAGLLALAAMVLIASLGLTARVWWPLRLAAPDDQVARFIEERCPEFEDRVVSAVKATGGLAGPLLCDTAQRLGGLDLDRVVSRLAIRRAGLLALVNLGVLVLVGWLGAGPASRAAGLVASALVPGRLEIAVSPGNIRIPAGGAVRIEARLGGASLAAPRLRVWNAAASRVLDLHDTGTGGVFAITLGGVTASFDYAVEVGVARSDAYRVTVLNAPRVSRIDLHYTYPKSTGLPPRLEEDGGDIYAPAGTRVGVTVRATKPLRAGALILSDGTRVPLAADGSPDGRATLDLTEDTSYRVALEDRDGLTSRGETEYFIRLLNDRPPDVRILRPAGDAQATPLEEVVIEARADDDHGIDRFELVYSVRGQGERVLPFEFDRPQDVVEGRQVLFLEALEVRPGDFVAYYARARDIARGKPPAEARSDIFFLEVKPFDEQFQAAQSGAMGGGSGAGFDDLASAQKDIIIATWKLDRRALESARRSADDIRAVARAQAEVRVRTEQAAAASGLGGRSRGPRGMGEGDHALARAAEAMGRAERALGTLDTKTALPHEMDALSQLLKAQSEIRRWQIARQQSAGGWGGMNRQTQDLSALFDRELQRQQQTNYETPATSTERQNQSASEALDKVKELARRQEALSNEQRALAQQRDRFSQEELARQLERLRREQSELRRQAEELSRQLAQQGQQGRGGSSGGQGRGESGRGAGARLREISEEMGRAASDLRREALDQAATRSGRAADRLRDVERDLDEARPNEQMRALGDAQLEARQIADAQQRLASEAARMANGTTRDGLRRLAGDKERLADRTAALEQALKRAAGMGRGAGAAPGSRALAEALAQLERQKLPEQMREAAARFREQASGSSAVGARRPDGPGAEAPIPPPRLTEADARAEREVQQALEALSKRLGSATASNDAESRRLADRLERAEELRERRDRIEREVTRLQDQIARLQGQAALPESGSGTAASQGAQGRQGRGGDRPGGREGDVRRLQEELRRQVRGAEELMNELRRVDPGAVGSTPEGQFMVTSAPGTEAFKQDFAKWERLRLGIDSRLEEIERRATRSLLELQARHRLNAGARDQAPEAYRRLVEQYYQALAAGKTRK